MLIGDPYMFAIILKRVEEWNYDEEFDNGILIICVDGVLFPNEIINVSLNSELQPLINALSNIANDKYLYSMPKKEAFFEMYNLTYPDDLSIENDYRFDLTPTTLSDNDYFIFAVRNNENIRIIATKAPYNKEKSRHEFNNLNICEVYITLYELNYIISKIQDFNC
jgi:hypothetical protein